MFVFRIAVASFVAYVTGQLLDVRVFSYLRSNRRWWVAPSASTIVGNLVDTVLFYTIAFYLSPDQFMATHWPEIALVDYLFKLLVSIVLFLPVYGIILRIVTDALFCRKLPASAGEPAESPPGRSSILNTCSFFTDFLRHCILLQDSDAAEPMRVDLGNQPAESAHGKIFLQIMIGEIFNEIKLTANIFSLKRHFCTEMPMITTLLVSSTR